MEEGAIVDGPNGTAYIVRGGQLVPMGAAGAAPQGGFAPVTLGQADPTKAALAQVQLARGQSDLAAAARAAANAPVDARILAARATEAEANAAIAQRNATTNNQRSGVTPAVRAASIAGYKTSQQLRRLITEMETLYKSGAGATKGINSLVDYLPTTTNKRFDAAGNAARGIVGSALGFTGGQLNTAAEAAMAVGPYLPQSSDRDEVIQDKIKRLRDLADQAEQRSVAQLGGRPDENGNIQPVAAGSVSAQGGGQGGNGGGNGGSGVQPSPPPVTPAGTVATGATKEQRNPQLEELATGLIRGGLPYEQVNTILRQNGASGDIDRQQFDTMRSAIAKGYRGPVADTAQEVGTSTFNRLAASPLGTYTASAGNAATAGLLGAATGTTGDFRRLAETNPTAGLLGDITGAALGSAGLELGLAGSAARLGIPGLARPVLADTAFGATSGATATEDNPLLGALAGGTLGAGGGIFGRAAGRAAGRGLRGIQNANVGALRQAGVPLTVGQAVGGVAKGIEDRLAGVPVIGDVINNRRREGLAAFNRAAFDEGLAPINADTGGAIGAQGVEAARAARSQGYANALDNVQVQADAPFVADMQGAINAGRALPDPMSTNLDYTLPTRVGNSFDAAGGLTGRDFQQAVRGLRRDAKAVEQLPYGYDFGQVTRQAEGALEGLLNRQAPGAVPAYQAANRANMNVEVLRDATNRARNGSRSGATDVFTPSQLSDAAAASAKKFGGTHGTTAQPFFNLTRAGQDVLPSSVPDSGTAGRLALLGLPAALGGTGAGAGALTGDTQTGAGIGLGAGALLAAGGSRSAQALAVRLLADRPDLLIRAGNRVYNNAALPGMFGAGAGAGALTFLTP